MKPSVTEKDIVCYKVVKIVNYDIFLTPYVDLKIPEDVISGEKEFFADDVKKIVFNELVSLYEISGGYIHTFSTLEEAKTCIIHGLTSQYMQEFNIRLVAYECIIPKGTKYFTGYAENGRYYNIYYKNKINMPINSYASDKIKFIKQISNYEMFDEISKPMKCQSTKK